jgi:hydroxymethylglutaryl-CoA lyase
MSFNYPKKVTIGDITVRDGFQHEEKFIPTAAKLWLAEELLMCGFKHIEVTNLGTPKGCPNSRMLTTFSRSYVTANG